MAGASQGFDQARKYPLFDAIWNRRSRRIARGIQQVNAGTLSYRASPPYDVPQPLSELEEAILIAATGATGSVLPDRPFQDNQQPPQPILGTPNLSFGGRAAGSTDNSQPTSFLMINDTGTYFLRRLPDVPAGDSGDWMTPDGLVERARQSKVKIRDERLFAAEEFRRFPFYLDSNRFLSNVPGSTIFLPIVDLSRQYINALMYVLTEEPASRPSFVDDRNFYRPAGIKRWMKPGRQIRPDEFALNADLKLPLGRLGNMRTEFEAYLLLQNMMLMLQAMGLGGWIHASIGPPYLLGDPFASPQTTGILNVRWQIPARSLWQRFTVDLLRWASPIPAMRANPCGLLMPGVSPENARDEDWLIKCLCPPNYTIDQAVDAVVREKQQLYEDRVRFQQAFRTADQGNAFVDQVPHYDSRVIQVAKEICEYLVRTHGRFPAHADGLFVPGIWIQAHHLNLDYYDQLFGNRSYTETHRSHDACWH